MIRAAAINPQSSPGESYFSRKPESINRQISYVARSIREALSQSRKNHKQVSRKTESRLLETNLFNRFNVRLEEIDFSNLLAKLVSCRRSKTTQFFSDPRLFVLLKMMHNYAYTRLFLQLFTVRVDSLWMDFHVDIQLIDRLVKTICS